MSAGAGRDPAAQARELEGLGEVTEGQAVGPELSLEVRAQDPGLDPRGPGGPIDFQYPAQMGEVDADGAGVVSIGLTRHLHSADDARTPAEGNGGDVAATAPIEQGGHIALAAGIGHPVRRVGEFAAERAHDVAVAGAVVMGGTVPGLVDAELRERGGHLHPGRP